jgi:hypothetical protein
MLQRSNISVHSLRLVYALATPSQVEAIATMERWNDGAALALTTPLLVQVIIEGSDIFSSQQRLQFSLCVASHPNILKPKGKERGRE